MPGWGAGPQGIRAQVQRQPIDHCVAGDRLLLVRAIHTNFQLSVLGRRMAVWADFARQHGVVGTQPPPQAVHAARTLLVLLHTTVMKAKLPTSGIALQASPTVNTTQSGDDFFGYDFDSAESPGSARRSARGLRWQVRVVPGRLSGRKQCCVCLAGVHSK